MRTRWLLLTLLCLFVAGPAMALNAWIAKATAYVPFDFVVNDTTLPAGNYVVSTHGSGNMLMIQNKDNPEYVKIATNTYYSNPNPNAAHEDSKLVFGLNNGQHNLHQVRIAGDMRTHDISHADDIAEPF